MNTDTLTRPPSIAAVTGSAGKAWRTRTRFRFGTWLIDPSANCISDGAESRTMEPRTMDVLEALCRANGGVVSAEELLEQCWGSTLHGDSPVHKNIAQLRRLLGDDAGKPRFIETIRKRGYRTVAPIDFSVDAPAPPVHWDGGSPFRGLLAFDAAHAAVFHGRDAATAKLAAAARAQVAQGLALVLLLGPSGAGKTSLVQAGLLPALARDTDDTPALLAHSTTLDLADQGEQTLFTALAGALLDLEIDDMCPFAGDNAIALGQRLTRDCAGVTRQLHAALAAHSGTRIGIFIDRFEALFNDRRVAEPERGRFLDVLEQLARCGACLLVLACRNDFYPNIAKCPLLAALKEYGGQVDLAPPTLGDIAQMIRRPAAAARLRFGVDPATQLPLDDILCERAAHSRDVLPLLQYCLYELYRQRTPEGELSVEAFRELGDLEGAIGKRAEQLVLGLSEAQRAELPHIMSLVTVLSPSDDLVTGQRVPWTALRSEEARQVVAALIEARLFVSDLAGGTPVFGVAHEAILRRWPRMSGWIERHRDALRVRARLTQQAQRWHAEGQRVDLLLPRGRLLDEARELQNAGLWSLEPLEVDLIRTSNRRARQFTWMRMSALALIVVLAVANSFFALSARGAQRVAEARRTEVEGLVDFMLGDFADKLRPLGRLELLEGVSGKALGYLRSSRGDELSAAGLTLRAKAMGVIGEVGMARGHPTQAMEALTEARVILMRQHRANPRDTNVISNLGNNAYYIGKLHKDHNDIVAAERAWREYLTFADMLHALEPDKTEWWVEQSYARNNLGSLAQARGHPELAAPYFAASITLKQRALARAPDSKMLVAELADSYSWLGGVRQAMGELKAASTLMGQEVALAAQLRQRFPDEPMWGTRYVRALQHRADLALALGDTAHAVADYAEARTILESIARLDPANRALQVELAVLELAAFRAGQRPGDARRTLEELTRVHATIAALAASDPRNAEWARSVAVANDSIGELLLAQGDVDGAKSHVDTSLASLRTLRAVNATNQDLRLALVNTLLLSASIHRREGDSKHAELTCREARGVMQSGIETTMNYQLLAASLRIHLCLHEDDQAKRTFARLRQIGYRDPNFFHLVPP